MDRLLKPRGVMDVPGQAANAEQNEGHRGARHGPAGGGPDAGARGQLLTARLDRRKLSNSKAACELPGTLT